MTFADHLALASRGRPTNSLDPRQWVSGSSWLVEGTGRIIHGVTGVIHFKVVKHEYSEDFAIIEIYESSVRLALVWKRTDC